MEQNLQSLEIEKEYLKKMTVISNQLLEDIQNFELENISLPSLHTLQLNLFEFLQEYQVEYDKIYQIFSNDYKITLKNQIQQFITSEMVKKVGTLLLYNKIISKPVANVQFIYELQKDYWDNLQNTMWTSSAFKPVLNKIQMNYIKKIDAKIQEEISNIGFEITPDIKENYKKAYYISPLSFQAFIESYESKQNKNQETIKQDSSAVELRDKFEKEIERKKIEELKTQQTQSFDNYNEYFNMDERELARLKRNPKEKRTISKISRRDKFSKSGGN